MLTIDDLFTYFGFGSLRRQASLKDYLSLPFVQDLLTLASHQNFDVLWSEFDLIVARYREERSVFGPLVMNITTYVTRGDTRAFFIDNTIGQLIGAIIQNTFVPQDIRNRSSLNTEPIYPARGRNMIDYVLQIPEGKIARFITADLSSFTRNCLNSWVMLLAALTMLCNHPEFSELNRPYLVNLAGRLFSVELAHMIYIYLYLYVGKDVYIPVWDMTTYSLGGYLGVMFNMSATMLYLCVFFKVMKAKLRSYKVRLHSQLGGDDINPTLIGKRDNVDRAEAHLKDEITTYVGSCKEWVVTDIDGLSDGVYPIANRFCKKSLMVSIERSGSTVAAHFQSIFKMPLYLQPLLKIATGARSWYQQYKSLLNGLYSYEMLGSNLRGSRNIYVRLFRTLQPLAFNEHFTLRAKYILGTLDGLIHHAGRLYSPCAYVHIESQQDNYFQAHHGLANFSLDFVQKTRIACARREVAVRQVRSHSHAEQRSCYCLVTELVEDRAWRDIDLSDLNEIDHDAEEWYLRLLAGYRELSSLVTDYVRTHPGIRVRW